MPPGQELPSVRLQMPAHVTPMSRHPRRPGIGKPGPIGKIAATCPVAIAVRIRTCPLPLQRGPTKGEYEWAAPFRFSPQLLGLA